MSMMSDTPVDIATLPIDIIRMIIRSEIPDRIDNMRLVSPEWTSLVLEVFSDKKRLPTISSILFYFAERGTPPSVTNVVITNGTNKNISYSEYLPAAFLLGSSTPVDRRVQGNICRSSIIHNFVLYLPTRERFEKRELDTVLEYLGDTSINHFVINYTHNLHINTVDWILDFIKLKEVQTFRVCLGIVHKRAARKFLEQASLFLRSIEIYENAYNSRLSGTFLGHSEDYWEALVEKLNDSGVVHAQFFENNDGCGEVIRIRVNRKSEKVDINL